MVTAYAPADDECMDHEEEDAEYTPEAGPSAGKWVT